MVAVVVNATKKDVPSRNDFGTILSRVSADFPWLRVRVRRDGVEGIDSRSSLDSATLPEGSTWGDDLYVEVLDNAHQHYDIREVVLDKHDELEGNAAGLSSVFQQEGRLEWHDEDPKQCLWRAVLVKWKDSPTKFAFVLSFHHLITDAIGAMEVARAIVARSTTNDSAKEPAALPPPMEDLMDTVPRVSHLLLPVLLDRFPALQRYLKPPQWRGATSHVEGDERSSHMVCVELVKEGNALTDLRRLVREKGVTVNSFCVSMLSKAVATVVAKNPAHWSSAVSRTGTIHLEIQVAANERPRCGSSANASHLGCYLSGPKLYTKVSRDDDWLRVAARFQKDLHRSIRDSAKEIGLCAFIGEDWIQAANKYEKQVPNGISDSIEVSNLGLVHIDDTSKWQLEKVWFAQGRRGCGAAMTVCLAGTPNGLNAVLSSFPQAVDKSTLEAIAKEWTSLVGRQLP